MSGTTSLTRPTVGDPAATPTTDPWAFSRFLEATRPGVMRPGFAEMVGPPAPSCHVLDAKYEPGVRAMILYDVGGRLVRGDVVPDTDAGADDPTVLPPGVRCSWFPADPELPLLGRLLDPDELGSAMARAGLQALVDPRAGASTPRIAVLRYRPGKRATLLVSRPTDCIVKAYHDPAKAVAVAKSCVALERVVRSGSPLVLAPTLAHLPELAAVVQGAVRGVPLALLLEGRRAPLTAARSAVRSAALALAELHSMTVAGLRERPVERELHRFGERAARIAAVAPQHGAAFARLADRLDAARAGLSPCRVGLVHGDCKPSQFLRRGEQVALLDLDHVGCGEQAADVGTFLASIRQLAARRPGAGPSPVRSASLEELGRIFLDSYRSRLEVDDDQVRWHEAVALERKALRAFSRAPGSPMVFALTTAAHRCLDELDEQRGGPPRRGGTS